MRSIAIFLVLAASAAAQTAADRPVPRSDANSAAAHAELLEKAKRGHTDIYFEGDSIVRRWGATDYPDFLANWKQNFHGWNAADFGWGGDTIQNVLWRLASGGVDRGNPKGIGGMAGTNNVGPPPQGDPQGEGPPIPRRPQAGPGR